MVIFLVFDRADLHYQNHQICSAVGELQDFLCPTQAATHFLRNQDALTDNLFNNLTNKIKNYDYIDNSFKFLNTESNGSSSLLHVNVRSLHKNFDLYEFIKSLNFLPHVICLSETRTKKDLFINIELTNYSLVHVDSKSNAGGVAIYIRNYLNYEIS